MRKHTKTFMILGRILLALIFIVSGFFKLTDIAGTTQYIAAFGVPAAAALAWVAGLLEVIFGLLLAIGVFQCASALILAFYLLVVSFVFHTNFADPSQTTQFMKNLAIVGGLLLASNVCEWKKCCTGEMPKKSM